MKVWNYIFLIITMMLVFQFAGLPSALNSVFGFLNVGFDENNQLNQTGVATSSFKQYLQPDNLFDSSGAGFFATLIGAGLALGLIVSGRSDIAIKAAFATAIFISFIPTIYFPITYALTIGASGWVTATMALIFIPFSVLFLVSLVEWVAGVND